MTLELFKFDSCPFCRKVIRFIEASGRSDIVFYDIHRDEDARKRLIDVGGKEQVPCLFIDGAPMYESGDIITWLEQHPEDRG